MYFMEKALQNNYIFPPKQNVLICCIYYYLSLSACGGLGLAKLYQLPVLTALLSRASLGHIRNERIEALPGERALLPELAQVIGCSVAEPFDCQALT